MSPYWLCPFSKSLQITTTLNCVFIIFMHFHIYCLNRYYDASLGCMHTKIRHIALPSSMTYFLCICVWGGYMCIWCVLEGNLSLHLQRPERDIGYSVLWLYILSFKTESLPKSGRQVISQPDPAILLSLFPVQFWERPPLQYRWYWNILSLPSDIDR